MTENQNFKAENLTQEPFTNWKSPVSGLLELAWHSTTRDGWMPRAAEQGQRLRCLNGTKAGKHPATAAFRVTFGGVEGGRRAVLGAG